MDVPESLPERLYLLTYNPDKQRISRQSYLGNALRAAALADLFLAGRLADDGGKVLVVAHQRPAGPANRVIACVLDQITASVRPRSWKYWVRKDARRTVHAVLEELETGRWIRVERHRLFGLVPVTTVGVRDARASKALTRDVQRVLTGAVPLSRVEPRVAALTALAATGEFGTVATWRERRNHRQRIAALAAVAGPAVPALRAVIRDKKAAASGG